jgi:large subunit ribosomal protein L13
MPQVKTETIQEKAEDLHWFEVSAAGLPLGRLASRVALVLRGKHKPTYSPNTDNGDFVIVTDAEKVVLTGNKWRDKMYYRHSGYPHGLKEESARHLRERRPELVIQRAVEGMLPHNALGRKMAKKLKVVVGSTHPYVAQKPEPLEL